MGADGASLRKLCRDEARSALEEMRSELLGGDLLCDELLRGGAGLRPALERLIVESPLAERERMLSEQVAGLRASVDSAVAAATAAATTEIGRLDGAFRSSLAAEVRELGSLCEGVRARIEALDESAADHIGRLSGRVAELEEVRYELPTGGAEPSTGCAWRPSNNRRFSMPPANGHVAAKEDTDARVSSHAWLGASSVDRANVVWPGTAPAPAAASEQELMCVSSHTFDGAEVPMSLLGSSSSPVPPFCASLAPLSLGIGPAPASRCAPSTPPTRHVPPASATAATSAAHAFCVSPGGGYEQRPGYEAAGIAPGYGRSNGKQWASKSPPRSPRIEARGGC